MYATAPIVLFQTNFVRCISISQSTTVGIKIVLEVSQRHAVLILSDNMASCSGTQQRERLARLVPRGLLWSELQSGLGQVGYLIRLVYYAKRAAPSATSKGMPGTEGTNDRGDFGGDGEQLSYPLTLFSVTNRSSRKTF